MQSLVRSHRLASHITGSASFLSSFYGGNGRTTGLHYSKYFYYSTEAASEPSGRIIEPVPGAMNPQSKTTGVMAVKCGMTGLWDKWGKRIPISILWVDDNVVSQVKRRERRLLCPPDRLWAEEREAFDQTEVGLFRAQGVPQKRKLMEFPVTEDAFVPVGTSIGVCHFIPGQYVDVTGIMKGKDLRVP